MRKIKELEIRIAKLEKKTSNSWVEMKIEEFEKSLRSVYKKNKRGLKKLKEILIKQGLNNPSAISKEIEKVGVNASPLEKEVLKNIKRLPTLSDRIEYLYSLWEEKYDSQFEKTSADKMIEIEDFFYPVLSHGLFYALKLSMGKIWLISFGLFLTKMLLIGMVLFLVLVDYGYYKKVKDIFISKSKDIKVASGNVHTSYPALVNLF